MLLHLIKAFIRRNIQATPERGQDGILVSDIYQTQAISEAISDIYQTQKYHPHISQDYYISGKHLLGNPLTQTTHIPRNSTWSENVIIEHLELYMCIS